MLTREQIEKAVAQMPELFHADELIEKLVLLEKNSEGVESHDNKRILYNNTVRKNISLIQILPLVESLPHVGKFQLIQSLLLQLADEEGVNLQTQNQQNKNDQGRNMAAILQRMADRNALSQIDDPVVWQQDIRRDRPLPDRD